MDDARPDWRLLAASRSLSRMLGWTMSDSYLFDVGWLFLAAWSAVVAAVSLAAFGRDLLPSSAHPKVAQDAHPADPVLPEGSGGTRA